MSAILGGIYDPIWIFFTVLLGAAFVIEAWAFVDVIRRPAGAFLAVGKQTKPIWLIISGVATAVGFAFFWVGGGLTSMLAVAAFVAGAVYHADVRPKVKDYRTGTGARSGPYGPW